MQSETEPKQVEIEMNMGKLGLDRGDPWVAS